MSGDGVVAHNRRTYFAENVDPTRTHLNVEYCYTPIEEAYHQLFDAALAEFNAKQKRKDRCIENYYEKIRDGKQEKVFFSGDFSCPVFLLTHQPFSHETINCAIKIKPPKSRAAEGCPGLSLYGIFNRKFADSVDELRILTNRVKTLHKKR